jgi:hypothetical protein
LTTISSKGKQYITTNITSWKNKYGPGSKRNYKFINENMKEASASKYLPNSYL